MRKSIVFSAIALVLFMAFFVCAEDKCIVSGEVAYVGDENIYVCLYNQETFVNWKKEFPPAEFMRIVKANPSGKVSFVFDEIPKGEYLIVSFVDENNNGKLDCDTEGWPEELNCTFKPFSHEAVGHNWHSQKFEVDKDITGIVVGFR